MFPEFRLRYSRLPERFYQRFRPEPVSRPQLVAFNRTLAEELGFDLAALPDEAELAGYFAGNRLPAGAEPVAQAYAGHQFGMFVPQLGDGRAVLLGEVVDRAGRLRDIQLKGSGPTRFARGGDGRAPLGPVLREYLVSEAMHTLGIPTTRSRAAVATGEAVYRERRLPGGVLTRVAACHVRVGTFEYFAARGDAEGLRLLADFVIERHYSQLAELSGGERFVALLAAVQERQATLVAKWMGVGFVHGVMNTDNTAVSGETIDYGPCAFMEAYHPRTVFSFIDHGGRYAYGNQPGIVMWNMARLAETLLPLIDPDDERAVARAMEVLERFPERYEAAWLEVMRAKLGLVQEQAGDPELIADLLQAMQGGRADFTLTFRRLCDCAESPTADRGLLTLFEEPTAIASWLTRWRQRLGAEGRAGSLVAAGMRTVNPLYIPRNHLVEQALAAAVMEGDLAPFQALHAVLARPFTEQPGRERYALPASDEERVLRTFCGT